MTISGDDNGQFVTDVTINGVTMPCLIDTGATTTSIPFDLAQKARLPIGQLNTASTANGLATTVSSGAQSLILGDNELFNVEVDVLYNLNITLVGMNVLRRFQITTSGNTMTLVPRWRSFAKSEGEGTDDGGAGNGRAVVAEAGSGKSAGAGVIDGKGGNGHTDTVRLPTGASAHGDSSGKKVAEWRKSVVCDDDGDCRTRYSR